MRRGWRMWIASVGAVTALATGWGAPAERVADRAASNVIRHEDAVPDRYIVVLQGRSSRTPSATARSLVDGYGGRLRDVFSSAIPAFATEMSSAEASLLSADPRVAYVEQDALVHVTATQAPATWGLDRIDERTLPLDGAYSYTSDGRHVTAYVIDTGIRLTHEDFIGRAVSGYDSVDGGAADDCNGHGTHVAGTIGGTTYGVAKRVSLVAVRVFGCEGSGLVSDVIAGVDWVTTDHEPGEAAVANMSLGGVTSLALDQAVTRSIDDGVTYVVAAGNGDGAGNAMDACTASPARVEDALTVSATDKSDRKLSWANDGRCVDLFAPGVGITSAWLTGDRATAMISGTSMAAPHVAGVAAQVLMTTPDATPLEVATEVTENATAGVVTSAGEGTPNLLLFEVDMSSSEPRPTPPSPEPGQPALSVQAKSTSRANVAILSWAGFDRDRVVVHRGRTEMPTPNDGEYRDRLPLSRTRASYVVCSPDGTLCSNAARVRF